MLLGARTAEWGGVGGGWMNPYVTDGLVAMWDGEWNADPGVHDANATVWKDLISGKIITPYSGSFSFEKDNFRIGEVKDSYAICEGDLTFSNCIVNGAFTVETVVKIPNYPSSVFDNCNIGIITIGGPPTITSNRLLNFDSRKNYGNKGGCIQYRQTGWMTESSRVSQSVDFIQINTLSLFSTSNLSPCYFYLNGENAGHSSPNMGAGTQNTAYLTLCGNYISEIPVGQTYNCYCLRFYNRQLDAEEISFNYAIDNARFNMP